MQHTGLAAKLIEEQRAIEMYDRMVEMGSIDPDCPTCQRYYGTKPFVTPDAFAPSHKTSRGCMSGSRPHCTCDSCF